MTKKQITVTLEQSQIDYVQAIADKSFEGNFSQALRWLIVDHQLCEVND